MTKEKKLIEEILKSDQKEELKKLLKENLQIEVEGGYFRGYELKLLFDGEIIAKYELNL